MSASVFGTPTWKQSTSRGAQIRGAVFNGSRMRGVELVDVDISGELQNVVVNGVDIRPLVEAELNRRTPERAKMRPDDSDGFREAWAILERLWKGTVARAVTLPAVGRGPGWDGIPWDREARPSIDVVLTVRRERQAMVCHVLETVTDGQLAADMTRTEPGWPRIENFPVK